MNHGRTAFQMFDRRVWSDRPLRLLAPADSTSPAADSDMFVEWNDHTLEVPSGSTTVMNSAWFTTHRFPQRYVFDMHYAGLRVDITDSGRHVRVHPLTADVSGRLSDPADTLVTNVLSRLPSVWGEVPLHSACLDVGHGLLLLCAMSGTGKSTLSQHLTRAHGWPILDDDTSVVRVVGGALQVVPMGARSRIRADAADDLGLVGEQLTGYAGGKQMLPRVAFDRERVARQSVAAVVHVLAVPAETEGVLPMSTMQGAATSGLVSLVRSTTPIDPLAPGHRQELLRVGALMAARPTWLLTYQRGAVSASDIAAEISSLVALLPSDQPVQTGPTREHP